MGTNTSLQHKFLARFLYLTIGFSLSGCVTGIIYSDVTEPLVLNMRNTPVGESPAEGSTKQLAYPLVTAGLQVNWDSIAIGDAMKAGGLTKAYFADLRTRSVLLGLWQKQTIIVYGSK